MDFLLQGLREAEEEEKKPFVVVVRNAGVAMYKGYMRLIVNKWGKLSRYFPLFAPSLPPLLPLFWCHVSTLWRCETEGPCFSVAVAYECLCCIRGLARLKGTEQDKLKEWLGKFPLNGE